MRGGGAERVAITIMSDFLARGFEVDLVLVAAEGELLAKVPPGVHVVDLGARRFLQAIRPLVRYLKQRRPHALQIRMWPLTVIGVVARGLARARTRLVLSDHTTLSRQYGGSPRTFGLLRMTVRTFYPLAEARVVVSKGAAEDLADLSGLPRDTFQVIHNPTYPVAQTVRIPAEVEDLWGARRHRIITVGTLKAEKNHALLIEAFARLRRSRDARLVILGDGPLLNELRARAEDLGIREDVIFAGFSDDPTPYVSSAHLFVLSSDFEGFGNVLVEAMALGVSVVSTDCPNGPGEILGDGAYGRLVPPGDAQALACAMQDALDQPTDPATLKEQADRLSGQGSIDRYLALMLGADAGHHAG
jgi:glycosyltransferase involved in cell wall biosynthesis